MPLSRRWWQHGSVSRSSCGVQGSFEKIREVSQPESLPESYLQTAQGLALEGCYVLGMSTKSLGSIRSEEATSLSRNAVEEGLSFSSLLVFRNELKPDTRDAIIDLKSGAVRPVMITGGARLSSFCPCTLFSSKEGDREGFHWPYSSTGALCR